MKIKLCSAHGSNKNLTRSGSLAAELLVDLPHLHGDDRLQQARAVLRAGAALQLEHGLRELAFALRVQTLHVLLDHLQLRLHVVHVDLAIHLHDRHRAAEPVVVVHLQRRTGLAALQGQVLLQRDHGECAALLLDQLHLQVWQALIRGLVTQDHVSVRLLRVHVLGEVRQALVDVVPDLLLRPATLLDVALHLPRELHLVHDVDVDAEVQLRARLLVVDGVQALEDHDLVRLEELRRVLEARVVVVDGFVHCLALLQRLDLDTHQREVVLPGIQGRQARGLAAGTVVGVVVVQADDSHHVADGRVPRRHLRAQGTQDAAQEGGLAAAGVRSDADDHRSRADVLGRRDDGLHVVRPSVRRVQLDAIHLPQLRLGLRRGPGQTCGHTVAPGTQGHQKASIAAAQTRSARRDECALPKEHQGRQWQQKGVGPRHATRPRPVCGRSIDRKIKTASSGES
mmetsp:Transcript_42916/g.108892  ORF Transcript_42916/g.108892 Transcript_42916/m.108892 type:complete len:455 (-) Transcript_42916:8-1372(-)